MGFGSAYYDGSVPFEEWLKQKGASTDMTIDVQKGVTDSLNNANGMSLSEGTAPSNQAQDTIAGMLESTLAKIPVVGTIAAGVVGAVNEGLTPHRTGETANYAKGFEKGVKNAAMSQVTGAATSAIGGAISADKGSLGSTYEAAGDAIKNGTGNPVADAQLQGSTLGQYADASPKAGYTTSSPDIMDKITGFAKGYANNASGGLIGGDYSPTKSSVETYPQEGSRTYDFVNGFEGGGKFDRMYGDVKGGNYGQALGRAARYTFDNYKRPHYDTEDFEAKMRKRYTGV